ncbi:MAG: substrate-binding domain-containing protein [Anaerolineales bacterium]|nr:substrate-binding domain-containing protein [Anaerolineales bacterium]
MANDNNKARKQKAPGRPTIGVMIARLGRVWGREFVAGLNNAAVANDVNLLCFVGGTPNQSLAGENLVYSLANPQILDGVILYSDLGHGLSSNEIEEFCSQFGSLPIISALDIPGLSTLLPDSYGGMRQLMNHLILVHQYRRIAFVRGPEGQAEAEQRYQAYRDALEEQGIAFDPALTLPGNYSRESGRAAIQILLDERELKAEAVVCANDHMAFGALEALQAHGLQVPVDMALVGFDDVDEARITGVPLTTVRQSFFTIGQQALENLLRQIKEAALPERIIIPTELVIRWSCGCLPNAVRQATTRSAAGTSSGILRDLRSRRKQSVKAMIAAASEAASLDSAWGVYASPDMLEASLSKVWEDFIAELDDKTPGHFITAFDQALQYLQVVRSDATAWHAVLSTLRANVLPFLTEREKIIRAENLFQQARLLVGEAAGRAQAYQRIAIEQQEETLQTVGNAISTVLRLAELPAVLDQHFPTLGIEHSYLALLQPDQRGVLPETSHMILHYQRGKTSYDDSGQEFPTLQLAPEQILPDERRYSAIVLPLTQGQTVFGFMVTEIGPREWEIYARLRNLFSSVIFRSQLVAQEEHSRLEVERLLAQVGQRAADLAAAKEAAEYAAEQTRQALRETEGLFAAARAILGATNPVEICQKLTSHLNALIQSDRVFIFLVDHGRRDIVLSVFDGNVVDDLQTSYEELNQGISGMVFRSGQPVLSTDPDDGIEPPETAERRKRSGTGSLIVVPLLSKGKVTGTVTALNRVRQRRFTQHDVDLLMALTTQAAAAIENAWLFSAEHEQRELAEALRIAGTILTSMLDVNEILDQLLIQIRRVVPFDSGSLMLVEGDQARVARALGYTAGKLSIDGKDNPAFPIASTPTFRTMKETGLPLLIPDTYNDPLWTRRPETDHIRSWLGAPVISNEGLVAFFSLNKYEPNFYTPKAAERLVAFVGTAALALDNARLYNDLKTFNQRLEQMVQERTEELRRAYQQLEQLDRTKSTFINVTSHELRTPLTVLSGYSQMLTADKTIRASDHLLRLTSGIESGARRMQEIVNAMLDVVKIDARELKLSPEPLSIAAILRDVRGRFINALQERNLAYEFVGMDQLPPIEADSEAIFKVFYNIVSNAIKYTPDGGKITITGTFIPADPDGFPDGAVQVSIQDTGIGIDLDAQDLVFTKFYQTGEVATHSSGTTKFKGGGPGLGLAIVRGMVQAHQGKIWVESPGYNEETCPGSTFHVALPLRQKQDR